MATAIVRIGVAVAMAAGLAACAPSDRGPLGVSDTSDGGGYGVCMPLPDSALAYVGIPVTNDGASDVELSAFSIEANGGAEAALMVDLQAVEHDQMIGSAIWPSDEGLAWMPEVLERAVDPVSAVIPAGETVDLLLEVGSTEPGANAAAGETTVDRVEIGYRSGAREYVLVRTGVARVLPDGAC